MLTRLTPLLFLVIGLVLALSACEKKQTTTPTVTATATTASGQLSTPTATAPPAVTVETKTPVAVETQTSITVDEVTLPSFDLSAELNINTEDLIVLGLGDLDVASFDTGAQDYGDITVDTTIDVSDLVDEAVYSQ